MKEFRIVIENIIDQSWGKSLVCGRLTENASDRRAKTEWIVGYILKNLITQFIKWLLDALTSLEARSEISFAVVLEKMHFLWTNSTFSNYFTSS